MNKEEILKRVITQELCNSKEKTCKVKEVSDRSDTEVNVYPENIDGYHIITPKDANVKPGDTIVYEPYGFNFGFYIRKETTITGPSGAE